MLELNFLKADYSKDKARLSYRLNYCVSQVGYKGFLSVSDTYKYY